MKLLVQKYLENHTFGQLAKEHGVYASFSKSGHKFSLNYDQIEAKESDPLAQECRGLILTPISDNPCAEILVPEYKDGKISYDNIIPGKTKVLAYPMKRFFNHGQGAAANIDWHDPSLAVLEKLDGTLCIVYYDSVTHQWCVATRSVPEADLLMDNGIFTFRTLFEKALQETCGITFQEYGSKLDPEITYCFELTTPYNRIVVEYKNCGVTLLAARSVLYESDQYGLKCVSLEELDVHNIETYGVPIAQAHTYTNVQELADWVSSLNPMEHEGVVVRDKNFNRIKLKNPSYVAYNKARDALGTSERNCLELVLAEKEDDVIPFLPEEIVKNLYRIKEGAQKFIKVHDEAYREAKAAADATSPGDKKTFAILVTKNKQLWSAPFFQMFDGKADNMKDFIKKNRDKSGSWSNSFLDKILDSIDI